VRGYGGNLKECDRGWGKLLECDRRFGMVPEYDRGWGKLPECDTPSEVFIITCNNDMRTVRNTYIFNSATSDIIYLTLLFTEACAKRRSDSWLKGDFNLYVPSIFPSSVSRSVSVQCSCA
jgi:hypothetical protein